MIKVTLPEQNKVDAHSDSPAVRQAALEAAQLYRTARVKAGDFNTGQYKLLANNCVTAVANVLNVIDASILGGKKKVVPQMLDKEVKQELSFESMVDECLRGSVSEEAKDEKDFIQFDATAHQVWEDVMTPVGKQSDMKARLKALKTEQDSTPQHDSSSTPSAPKL